MTNLQEVIQGAVALALIGAYVILAALGKQTDHLDLGIFAILGIYFSGKVTQTAQSGVEQIVHRVQRTGPRATDVGRAPGADVAIPAEPQAPAPGS